MKVRHVVFIAAMLLTLWQTSLAQCFHQLYGNQELNKTTLSIPTKIIAKVVEKLGDKAVPGLSLIMPDIEVTLEFSALMEFKLDCSCSPCCRVPQKQVASLRLSSSIRALGGTVSFFGVGAEACEGRSDPAPGVSCECPVTIRYETGVQVPAVGVGLSLGGVKLRTESVIMSFSAVPHCGCTTDPRCFANTAPSIAEVSPAWLDLNKGQSATIVVTAVDKEGNLEKFLEPEGGGYLLTHIVPGAVWFSADRTIGRAVYRLEFPLEGEELRGFAPIRVMDACGQGDGRNIPVRLFYPPVLTSVPEGSGWGNRDYLQVFMVDDPDFNGCNYDRWEVVTVTAKAECGEVYPLEARVSCGCLAEECRTLEMTFTPPWVLQAELYDRGHGLVACGGSDRTPSCGGGGPAGGCREGRSPGATLEAR